MIGNVANPVAPSDEMANFIVELKRRRDLVYDYLDNWPGTAAFKPDDVHEGIFSYVRHRGKGLRPMLLMLCAAAVGGDEEQAVPAAAAVEVFHIWTLVHDDVIDRDDTRRGSPTVHARYRDQGGREYGIEGIEAAHYGTAVAIISGDMQQSWSYALMCDLLERGVAPDLVLKLIRKLAISLTPQLLEGEMLDVQFALMPVESVTQERILHMLTGKSAALLEYAAWAGATIGLGDRPDPDNFADKLGRFALLSGLAFQLHDDILGLTADAAELGKPIGSDLREGKQTLLLQRALAQVSAEERAFLLNLIGNHTSTNAETNQAIDIIRKSGAIRDVTQLANEYVSQSIDTLSSLPDNSATKLLRSWADYLLSRSF